MTTAATPRYLVHVSDAGNVFMVEIAQQLVAAIEASGREVQLRRSGIPVASPDVVNLVVAPHEYLELLDVPPALRAKAAAASVCVNTEQPGTPWFELSAGFAAAGGVALDINASGAEALRARGIPTLHLPLGYHTDLDRWHGDPERVRPVDVLFLGGATPRREAFLAESAHRLWPWRSDLRLFTFEQPVVEGSPQFVTGPAKYDLLASTRVLLNVHRSEVPYFEWVRVLEAMANGCVVASEPSLDLEPLVPGEHLLVAPLAELAEATVELLADERRRAAMAAAAYELLRTELDLDANVATVLDRLERADIPAAGPQQPPSSRRLTQVGLARGQALIGRLRRAPSAAPPPARPPVPTGPAVDRVAAAMLAESHHLRRGEALGARLRHDDATHVEVLATPAYADATPEVTVVVSLFNYAQFVDEALESVAASRDVDLELLVVDDHSRDDSRLVVERFLHRHPTLPAALLARAANAGLSAARNLGFARARAPFVFVLDADNAIYPTALRRLLDAIAPTDAAFAYSIIEQFGNERGLVSQLPWDPERLVRANYIDAMALVRRAAWEELGGYDDRPDSPVAVGWEDYDLWLRAAAHGHHGVLVREILTRYRIHGTSMLDVTNLYVDDIFAHFRSRYPRLPW